jgi:putative membrane protein
MSIRFATVAALCFASTTLFAQTGAKPTDPQIAHIAYTAGELDIAAAKQALDLVKKLHVTPEDNDTSRALTKAATAKRGELAKLSGAAFDTAYVENEVAFHKTVDNALETTLIPSASNAELKSLLQTGLKIFQGHEQHAEHVAASLK